MLITFDHIPLAELSLVAIPSARETGKRSPTACSRRWGHRMHEQLVVSAMGAPPEGSTDAPENGHSITLASLPTHCLLTLGPDSLGWNPTLQLLRSWAKDLSSLCPCLLSVRSILRVCLQVPSKGSDMCGGLGRMQPLPKRCPSREGHGVAE